MLVARLALPMLVPYCAGHLASCLVASDTTGHPCFQPRLVCAAWYILLLSRLPNTIRPAGGQTTTNGWNIRGSSSSDADHGGYLYADENPGDHNAVLQSQFPHLARQYEEVGLAVQQEQEEQSGYNSDPGLRNNPVTQSLTEV